MDRDGKARQGERRGQVEAAIQRRHRVLRFRRLHHRDADGARDQVDRMHDQREQDSLHAEYGIERRPQNHRADVLGRCGLEDVRSATRAVADVVTDQVRDHGRIPWIVLRNARLDLAHQIRAHIRGLGVDSSAKLRKQCYQRRSEPEPDQLIRNRLRIR